MSKLPGYPLVFEPILKERIWGGSRLAQELGKKLPSESRIGESWEISDHGADVSVVACGPLQGRTLRELVGEFPESVLGSHRHDVAASGDDALGRFPLLVKWIDTADWLSVQVHPPDGHPRLLPGERGKTECWFVLDAAPGAEVLVGLRRGIDRSALLRELSRGTTDRCLNVYPARAGDFFFTPAGTVHAIGPGVLLAEIQQSSDTTFRLFDWNRLDPATGRSRELHVEAALESIDYRCGAGGPIHRPIGTERASQQVLLEPQAVSPFCVTWRSITAPVKLGQSDRFHVLVCLEGRAELTGGGETIALQRGDCALLPATGLFDCRPSPRLEVLDSWIP